MVTADDRRRCEPSPLVAPDHPDAAKLPCARCRRFALECIRVKVSKRKGPAPVYVTPPYSGQELIIRDLSAISDAAYGFVAPVAQEASSLDGGTTRPFSSHADPLMGGPARQSSDS